MNPVSYLKARRTINLLAIAVWMGVIFFGSSIPQKEMPPAFNPVSKLGHVVEYAVLGFLIFPLTSGRGRPILYAVLLSTAYAATDEFHQLFTPGRHGSPLDVLIDSFGSTVGSYLAVRWSRR